MDYSDDEGEKKATKKKTGIGYVLFYYAVYTAVALLSATSYEHRDRSDLKPYVGSYFLPCIHNIHNDACERNDEEEEVE